MAAPIFNPDESSNTGSSQQRKRRKIGCDEETPAKEDNGLLCNKQVQTRRWRTETEQQIYSSKLIEALRRVRQNSFPPLRSPSAFRQIRETADRVLAVSAKGRTRWSRAILASRQLSLKLKNRKRLKRVATDYSRSRRPAIKYEKRKLSTMQRKVGFLGRLVPGCRKLPFPNLLVEATDYIAALEMQVRAMTALTQLLTDSTRVPTPPVE